MQLRTFRVRKFRNIEDSGEIELFSPLTCVVGKNQSGKSALLRALHKFNPHSPEPYDMRREWPRGQRTSRDMKQVVCEVRGELSAEELVALGEILGHSVDTLVRDVVVRKDYAGDFEVEFPEEPDVCPNPLSPQAIDSVVGSLPSPTGAMREGFRNLAMECVQEAATCLKEERVHELTDIRENHRANLQQWLEDDGSETGGTHEEQFVTDYVTRIEEIQSNLNNRVERYGRVRDWVVRSLPTFIYMDDYKAFHGRAKLNVLQNRRDSQDGDLSEEDETCLMILKLAGLDLDQLIRQGESGDQELLHDRQLDLQDAATTLTSLVAGRWGQNEYQVQFRADGRTFFTEIEETNKSVGMIPLEEQSKGFQWFFSFDLHFMHESEGTFEGCVLLLDEPGLHLHPGGQDDLLRRLDAYAERNTLIYTTHLPFLVDLREPKRIKIIKQTATGAVVSDNLQDAQKDERLTLQAALGMKANQSYLVSERNLLVEGVNDYWIIAELSKIFERKNRSCLPDDVMITAAGSASDIVPMATFMIGQGLNVVSLFDSDTAGKEAEKKLRESWLTSYKNARAKTLLVGDAVGMAGSEATIEDLFPESYYLEKTRESHETKLKGKGLSVDVIRVQGEGPILPRMRQCFAEMGVEFNKGSVAKRIRRDLVRCSKVTDLPDGVAEKASALFKALRAAFGASDVDKS